jgi:hypothetical protein
MLNSIIIIYVFYLIVILILMFNIICVGFVTYMKCEILKIMFIKFESNYEFINNIFYLIS